MRIWKQCFLPCICWREFENNATKTMAKIMPKIISLFRALKKVLERLHDIFKSISSCIRKNSVDLMIIPMKIGNLWRTMDKKSCFPLGISSVNVTKFCHSKLKLCHIDRRNLYWKSLFYMQCEWIKFAFCSIPCSFPFRSMQDCKMFDTCYFLLL